MTGKGNDGQINEGHENLMGQNPAKGSSKKGLVVGVIVLVAVVVIAAIAYSVLAPVASNEGNRIVTSEPSSFAVASSAASDNSANQSGEGEQGAASEDSSKGEETEAPDFTVTDANGAPVSLSQFKGKPIVLNFWASTCGPCQSEMPEFQSAFEEHGKDVQFMMVDVIDFNGETEKRAKDFIADSKYTFPVFFDTNGDATMKYGLNSIPKTYFIDSDGHAIAMASGSIDLRSLERGIEMIQQ